MGQSFGQNDDFMLEIERIGAHKYHTLKDAQFQ